MGNNLKVVKPFDMMEAGDVFKLSDNGNYVSNNEWSHSANDVDDSDFSASIKQTFEISKDYAELLVKAGFLSDDSSFVNVFDEIERLAKKYATELDNIDKDYTNAPACMKVEKETVLTNMIKVLEHLHSLKK